MNAREALKIVVGTFVDLTGSKGSPNDEAAITAFLADVFGVPNDVVGRVCGIEVRKFFSFNEAQFNAQKASIWQELDDRYQDWLRNHGQTGKVPLSTDLNWGFTTDLDTLSQHVEFNANNP